MKYTFVLIVLFSEFIQFCYSQSLPDSLKLMILEQHNFQRKIVGSPPLEWSEELELEAQNFANSIAKNPLITHYDKNYGQNLYYIRDTSQIPYAIQKWIDESLFYYGQAVNADNLRLFQHYTQIIWCKTKYIGCALSKLPSGMLVFVCLYLPAGNQLGESPLNCK